MGMSLRHRTTWELEQHTRIKHQLLRKYLAAWFPILARGGYRRIVFFDGFAGPGIYSGGELGSPIIALDTLVNHRALEGLSDTQFTFIFVENNTERFNSLERELKRFRKETPRIHPRNVIVNTYKEEFTKVAERTAQFIQTIQHSVPMFVFIDPFGSSGIPMSTIHKLLSLEKCEVLINFMYDGINRFISDSRPAISRHFAELFGTDEYTLHYLVNQNTNERKIFLRDLYMESLQRVGGCKFADSFEIWDNTQGRTKYFLIFGTHNIRGLEEMKKVMWLLDPIAGEISGTNKVGQLSFEFVLNLSKLKEAMLGHFLGQKVTIEEIGNFVITDTPYLRSHAKTVLRQLESENKITILSNRKQKNTYPDETIIRFTVNENTLF